MLNEQSATLVIELITKFRDTLVNLNEHLADDILKYNRFDYIKDIVKNKHILQELRSFQDNITYLVVNNIDTNFVELCEKRKSDFTWEVINKKLNRRTLMNSTADVDNMVNLWQLENTGHVTQIYDFFMVWHNTKPGMEVPNFLYHGYDANYYKKEK